MRRAKPIEPTNGNVLPPNCVLSLSNPISRSRVFVSAIALFVPVAALQAQNNSVLPFTFTTLAGSAIVGSMDGTGAAARFTYPTGMTVDGTGNIYVIDRRTIRKITPAGVVTTLAGSPGKTGSADGTGNDARFQMPPGIAVDGSGNVYVSDWGNATIRKITAAGVVTTFAGSAGTFGSGPIDGVGSAARFVSLNDGAVDGTGNVYVADYSSVRKITSAGMVTALAELAHRAESLAVDQDGNVYVVDTTGFSILKITASGTVTTLAGAPGMQSLADGIGSAAHFRNPGRIKADKAGNLFVTDYGNTIRKITSTGVVTTPISLPSPSSSYDGVGFSGLEVDEVGNLYVVDIATYPNSHVIRKISPLGAVTNLAGAPTGSADGIGSSAQFDMPHGTALDGAGNVYVADRNNHTIRKITAAGAVTTLAGMAGVMGSKDGVGTAAQFNHPESVTVDGEGNVYVADTVNSTIRKITSAGVVTTFAGSAGIAGSDDGMGMAARFGRPSGVAVDGSGNVYVADARGTIRKITPAGMVTTLAGRPNTSVSLPAFSYDGTGSHASFTVPYSLTVDGAGNLYVNDAGSSIRKVTATGVVTTLAGVSNTASGYVDGVGSSARFRGVSSLAVDGVGDIYVADTGNHTIRKVTSAGVVTTVAGVEESFDSVDGAGSSATFYAPIGLAIDRAGNLYISDNNTIRKGVRTTTKSSVDFNSDGKSDILFSNTVTGDRAMWLMDGTTVTTNAFVGTVSVNWIVSSTGDFNGDGKSDIFWTNLATGDRAIWLMNGSVSSGGDYLGTVPVEWVVSGTGDFDGDGKADIFWTNTVTGECAVWLMNGLTKSGGNSLGVIPVAWVISGVGDLNADGMSDVLLSNTVTGDCAVWLMNGAAIGTNAFVSTLPVTWKISGVGDFNGDGKADLFWTNAVTGDRAVWLMNGASISGGDYMGAISLEWVVNGARDFNGDSKADLVWTNTVSGERVIWLMDGVSTSGGFSLGTVPVEWKIH